MEKKLAGKYPLRCYDSFLLPSGDEVTVFEGNFSKLTVSLVQSMKEHILVEGLPEEKRTRSPMYTLHTYLDG